MTDHLAGAMRTRYLIIAAVVMPAVLTLSGCGTRRPVATPSRPSASAPASAAPEGPCSPEDAHATPCVPDVERLQESNHAFQRRMEVPQNLLDAQIPARKKVTAALNRLTAGGRRSAGDITAALRGSGAPIGGIDLLPMTNADVHQFGVLVAGTRPAICVFGTITAVRTTVDLGGIIQDGGCVPGPVGH